MLRTDGTFPSAPAMYSVMVLSLALATYVVETCTSCLPSVGSATAEYRRRYAVRPPTQ
jgi:hypothetical protein